MPSAGTQTCVRCGQGYSSAQMEITEDGPRCFRCSQAAAIDQHHANSAAQLESHNRAVIMMGGFKFWSLEFHCTGCDAEVDGSPGPFGIALPPETIACEKCGRAFVLSFWHRARWLYSVIAKLAFLVVLAVRWRDVRDAMPRGWAVVVAEVALSFGIAMGVAIVLTIPVVLATRRKKPSA